MPSACSPARSARPPTTFCSTSRAVRPLPRIVSACLMFPAGFVVATTGDDTRWGAVVGAGLEFGFAPNWSAGVEYNHLFMQDRTHTFVDTTGALLRQPTASARTSISSPCASTIAGAALSSRSTDLRLQQTNYRKGRPRAGLFVWLYRGIVDTRYGCIAHIFAADVVFRRQHFAMTSRYMRRQPEIDYCGSCVGNAEEEGRKREENFVDDDCPDRAWDRPRGRRRSCRTALHQGARRRDCDQ